MKRIKRILTGALGLLSMTFFMSSGWRTDFETAKTEAAKKDKLILLKFSGSDWCIPCIKMEKDIFSTDEFSQFAEKELVMVNADFPRKKGTLDEATIKQNEMLAEKYDKVGHFPYTVLLDADGKVLQEWDGYQVKKPEAFIEQIMAYAGNHTSH